MSNLNDKYQEIRAKIKELKDEKTKIIKQVFTEAAREIFVNHPGLTSFKWTQYTPYFNDGDACIFSVNRYDIEVNGAYSYEEESSSIESFEEIEKEVRDFLGQFEEEDFLEMFGDHVQIAVTPDGIEVEDYAHD